MVKIVVVGQPNVGKSMLINAVTKGHLKVGNFSGVTVEKEEIAIDFHGTELDFIDLPGSYSLKDYTIDEKVTSDFLKNGEYDLIVNVIDSTHLKKNLYLTTQLLELNRNMIVVLNMIDEAEKKEIQIDVKQLSSLLGVPVLKTSASEKRGMKELLEEVVTVCKFGNSESKIIYSDPIEEEILNIQNFLDERKFKDEELTNRQIAIKLLQNSKEILEKLHNTLLWVELSKVLRDSLEHIYIHFQEKDMENI